MAKSQNIRASEADIKLVEGKGSKEYGGSKGGHYWHIYYNEQRAGRVFINLIEDKLRNPYPSITVELNQNSRGKGIGSIAFRRGCELSQYNEVFAEMRKSNVAAQIAAKHAGFKLVKNYKGGQVKMVWHRRKSV